MTDQPPLDRTAPPIGRRRLLAGAATATATALAGCSSGSDAGPGEDDGSDAGSAENDTDGGADTGETPDATPTETPQRLETDVTGLLYAGEGSTREFRVTVQRDRVTEGGYPAAAVLETASGETLAEESFDAGGPAERTVEFSASVPDGTTRVIARGVDSYNGRGGTAMVADLEAGEIEAVEQGAEPQSFG